jgi:hypothetical protein
VASISKIGNNSTTLGELVPELEDVMQLALESTGIFARKKEELEFNLSSLNIFLSTATLYPHQEAHPICMLIWQYGQKPE